MASTSICSIPTGARSSTMSPLMRFHQGSGDRSQPAHLAAVEIGLVDADDRDRHFGPAPGGVGDGRAEKDLVQLLLLVWVDHLGTLEPFGQEADAPINLAQAALAVNVVAVFRPVAVPSGPGHGFNQFRTIHPQ